MSAMTGAGPAMAASVNEFLRPQHMRPRPIPATALGHREIDGSYPFRAHRTCAEWMGQGA